MKINANDRYYFLLLHALENIISPELSSSAALAAAQMMKVTLGELMKREHGGPNVLIKNIRNGQKLLVELSRSAKLDCPKYPDIDEAASYVNLISIHEQLTADITIACQRLTNSITKKNKLNPLLLKAAEWELSYYEEQAALKQPELSLIVAAGSPLDAKTFETFLNEKSDQVGKNNKVTDFRPLPGGFGKQTYLCTYADDSGQSHELVIRKTDPTPIMSHGGCCLENEFSLLRTLAQTGFPAPKPIEFCANWGGLDGSFYTMARASGVTPGSYLDGVEGKPPQALFLELAECLGRLHSTPLSLFEEHIKKYNDSRIIGGNVADAYRYNIEAWETYIHDEHHLASPYIVWLLNWLKTNIPELDDAPVLVHGDYNVHNVLVDDGAISIILDWECADFGTPEQDLAYLKPNIEEHISWDDFLAHYKKHGGKTNISEHAMKFGAAYTALRTNLAGNRGTFNLQTGRNQDLRYIMVELGFTQSFMGVALENARTAQ